MAQIVIKNLEEKTIELKVFSKTLLQNLQDHAIDWMHACGGKGKCTTCKVIVLEGEENLGPKTDAEMKYTKEGAIEQYERLACQVLIKGNVSVMVPGEFKLPHVRYSD